MAEFGGTREKIGLNETALLKIKVTVTQRSTQWTDVTVSALQKNRSMMPDPIPWGEGGAVCSRTADEPR